MSRFLQVTLAALLLMAPAVMAQKLFEGPTQFIPVEVDRMYVKGLLFLVLSLCLRILQ